jgi:hypothetical protein
VATRIVVTAAKAVSMAIDNAAGHLEAFNGDNSRSNYRDLRNEKGLGSYNQPWNNSR